MFRVLSCVIYTIISKNVCIDNLGSEKSKLSDLRLGVSERYKRQDVNRLILISQNLNYQYKHIC